MNHLQEPAELVRRHMSTQLGGELAFFRQHRHEWLPAHRGEFVVLGKQTFGGFYKTYPDALRAGTRMFGLVSPFLIEEIREEGK